MVDVPSTSTTLLRDLTDSQHARWTEFFARYCPMMEAYMRAEFPDLDAADLERNAVDQIKSRMMDKLRKLVAALEKTDTANLK